ncbi:MAG: hypothetical protein CM15mP58_21760 [Burkholderiaceae bacterium]|nr:MAG: hypothetical protein CM15mP58_21760 [Burkholderiaceae bacterium]
MTIAPCLLQDQDRVSDLENQDDQFSLLSGETTQDTNKIDEDDSVAAREIS